MGRVSGLWIVPRILLAHPFADFPRLLAPHLVNAFLVAVCENTVLVVLHWPDPFFSGCGQVFTFSEFLFLFHQECVCPSSSIAKYMCGLFSVPPTGRTIAPSPAIIGNGWCVVSQRFFAVSMAFSCFFVSFIVKKDRAVISRPALDWVIFIPDLGSQLLPLRYPPAA